MSQALEEQVWGTFTYGTILSQLYLVVLMQVSYLVLVNQEVASIGLQLTPDSGRTLSEREQALLYHTGEEHGTGVDRLLGRE